jgi:hypothetical protein
VIVNGNDNINPKRLMIGETWRRIQIQPIAPNAVRIAPTQEEIQYALGALNDGIQLNASVLNSEIFRDWWRRELWIIGVNNAPWSCILTVPGLNFLEIFVE